MNLPKTLNSVRDVAHDYDGFIVDLWGVVHNGHELFPHVEETLAYLKQNDKTVVLLSNAPRSSGVVKEKLDSLGLRSDLYTDLVTSGDSTVHHLRLSSHKTYFHIGSEAKDSSLRNGIGMNPALAMWDADVILASNLFENRLLIDQYTADFEKAIANKVPMVCANPDKIVRLKDSLFLCSGVLAEHYETLGGKVTYFGKPYKPVYDYIFNKYPGLNWIALGDSVETDIRGATTNGFDSILVSTGIHKEHIQDNQIEDAYTKHNCVPTFLIDQMK